MDLAAFLTPAAIAVFFEILLIDIVLAGDNAIVVGALAAGLPAEQRKKVILIGVLAALVLRIAFALLVTQLLQVVGLILAGGLLLLWVAWKMWRELRTAATSRGSAEVAGDEHSGLRPARSFAAAAWGVALADVSMSLDNVLAVAGAAREHPWVLVVGLILSVILMGIAANLIAKYIERYRWIAWIGLAVILWVAAQDDLGRPHRPRGRRPAIYRRGSAASSRSSPAPRARDGPRRLAEREAGADPDRDRAGADHLEHARGRGLQIPPPWRHQPPSVGRVEEQRAIARQLEQAERRHRPRGVAVADHQSALRQARQRADQLAAPTPPRPRKAACASACRRICACMEQLDEDLAPWCAGSPARRARGCSRRRPASSPAAVCISSA